MKAAFLLLLATLCSCSESGPSEPAWGAVFVCGILSEEPPRLKDQLRIIERRLAWAGFPQARFSILPEKRIEFRVPGADDSNIHRAASAILGRSLFEVFEVGDAATQASWARHRIVPEGFRAFHNVESAGRPGPPWDSDVILVRDVPSWGSGAIQDAWVELESDGARRVSIKLISNASVPSTPVAIVQDGKVAFLEHIVNGERKARVVRALQEEDAKYLAYIFLGSTLTLSLGGGSGGIVTKGPESWGFYGTPPAKAP